MKRILVTGAGGSAASNFINSLRISGEDFYIVGTDINLYHLELASGVDKKYLVPPATDPGYLEKINLVIEKEQIEFVHPQPDIEVLTLARNRDKIKARTLLPSTETVELCQNKIALIDYLKERGVPVPLSFRVESKNDLARALGRIFTIYPKAWLRPIRGFGSKATLPITSLEQAHLWISYWESKGEYRYEEFMVCEFLPGKEYAFQSLWRDGEVVTSQARERLEYIFGNLTPSGQSSSPSVARTVHNEKVNEVATNAVKAADALATGIFCVDIKENREGVPCVTEINSGRFFTTSNFFATAGLNMPLYYVKIAFGEEIPDLPHYNALPEGWYWIRYTDMGHKLIKGENWSVNEI